MTTKKLHYFSGLTISVFVGIHLLNHLLVLFGDEAHIAFMDLARLMYRSILGEVILMLAIGIQVVSGVLLVSKKRKEISSIYDRLHIYSGLYLSFFFLLHTTAIFMGRYNLGLDTNLYYGAAVLNAYPMVLFFVPYYSLSIISFFTHIACIHRNRMRELYPNMESINRQANTLIGLGILVAIVIILGMMQVEIPVEYRVG